MKKILFVLILLCVILPIHAQKIYWGDEVPVNWTGDWAEEFLTTAEKTNYESTSSHRDVLEFINVMRWNSEFVHTLNNTAIATPRILVPFLENHQNADSTVNIPKALRPFLGGISKKIYTIKCIIQL